MSDNIREAHPKFLKWIEEQGGCEAVARMLKVSIRAVQWWRSGHQVPNSLVMLNILDRANGELTPLEIVWARRDYFGLKASRLPKKLSKSEEEYNIPTATGKTLDHYGDRIGMRRKGRTDAEYRVSLRRKFIKNRKAVK